MPEEKNEATRIRIAYKISAKGIFQPDVTSEAENVKTAMLNLTEALAAVEELATARGEFCLSQEK